METTGKIKSISRDIRTGRIIISFEIEEVPAEELQRLSEADKLTIKATKYQKHRSLDANAYFWVLCGRIAEALGSDKWTVYTELLSRYGQYTHVVCRPEVVGKVKQEWRATEELGPVTVNGQQGIQLRCYIGSSNYDTREMSVLIDGTVSEAKELGIETLPPEEVERLKHEWNQVNPDG